MVASKSTAWAGMVVFAATMMLIMSLLNIIEGLLVLFNDDQLVLVREKFVLVDLTAWGWTLLLFGLALFAVGVGLLATQTWARIAGIIVVGLHAVWQVASLGAYPIWSLLMLAIDTFVIFALTARWSSVRPEPETLIDQT
ncbi:hypothetical protein ACFQFC_07065 [Amorphoplanes digitatis]|uniref:Putative membrane protein n=1 Tax=Actinoplanes digitatis TaxID=1868 RepID=A0A7W7I054_9ACTN|nr:hypothetical protein [Actinoplanes digitatis]MBB4763960.1 putative membrane protein [Actinoplanes digitatis]BFE73257.1 hypothetical protein GCM10020092_065580 [Actinoplanes digitatis]GID93779.1 hypothetical protein Adi01nite_31910 [Actinoplanes digitatis]